MNTYLLQNDYESVEIRNQLNNYNELEPAFSNNKNNCTSWSNIAERQCKTAYFA